MAKDHDDHDDGRQIAVALEAVVEEIKQFRLQRQTEFEWIRSHLGLATKLDLKELKDEIMSVISEFAAKQTAFNNRQGSAIDSLVASVAGVTGDVKALNDKITELQNSQGGVTPEDQALIDGLQSQGDALATRLESVSTALAAIDAATPPVVPPVP